MIPPTQSEVHLFGRKIPQEKERKFLLMAGAVGIVGVLLLVYNQRKAATGSAVSGPPSVVGSSGASASTGDSSTGTPPSPAPLGPDIEIKFDESTSPKIGWTSSGASGGGGGFSIGLPGFSIGASGGGGANKTNAAQLEVANTFSTDTIIHNANAGTLQQLLDFIKGMAGTQEERASQAQQEINQLYPYTQPGHTIAGVVAHEQAQQALEDAKNQAAINKILPRPLPTQILPPLHMPHTIVHQSHAGTGALAA